ncbi:MAG: thermonuclease family protein [Alphaproteobacteria bacterium]|nr:thermonuclease family protein [Alphaproteobacteria bacterium]
MRIYQRILQLIVVSLLFIPVPPLPPAQAAQILRGPFPAEIITVIDGDTIQARIFIWLDLFVNVKVRLQGVDTPEINGKCGRERELAQQAKTFAETWLTESRTHPNRASDKQNRSKKIIDKAVVLINVQYGKYAGRVVADIQNRQGETLSAALIEAGLAQPYGVPAKWCA